MTITSDLRLEASDSRMVVWYRDAAVRGFDDAVREWVSVWGWTKREPSRVLSSCHFDPAVSGGGCRVVFARPTSRGHWFPAPRDVRRLRWVMATQLKVETARLLDGDMAGCCCAVPAGTEGIFVGRAGAEGVAEVLAGDMDTKRRQLRAADGAWAVYVRVPDLGPDTSGRYAYRCTRPVPERRGGAPIATCAALDAFLAQIGSPATGRDHEDAARWKELEHLLQETGFPSPPQEITLPARLERSAGNPPAAGQESTRRPDAGVTPP